MDQKKEGSQTPSFEAENRPSNYLNHTLRKLAMQIDDLRIRTVGSDIIFCRSGYSN